MPKIRIINFANNSKLLLILALCFNLISAMASDAVRVGIFKIVDGQVTVQRNGSNLAATVGMPVHGRDIISTGANSAAGVTFEDDTLLSLGAQSELAVEQFSFNSTTHEGRFETKLARGKLAVVSGKIAKQQKDAMKVKTPNAILGVRGTRFVIEADGT